MKTDTMAAIREAAEVILETQASNRMKIAHRDDIATLNACARNILRLLDETEKDETCERVDRIRPRVACSKCGTGLSHYDKCCSGCGRTIVPHVVSKGRGRPGCGRRIEGGGKA